MIVRPTNLRLDPTLTGLESHLTIVGDGQAVGDGTDSTYYSWDLPGPGADMTGARLFMDFVLPRPITAANAGGVVVNMRAQATRQLFGDPTWTEINLGFCTDSDLAGIQAGTVPGNSFQTSPTVDYVNAHSNGGWLGNGWGLLHTSVYLSQGELVGFFPAGLIHGYILLAAYNSVTGASFGLDPHLVTDIWLDVPGGIPPLRQTRRSDGAAGGTPRATRGRSALGTGRARADSYL